MLEAGGTAGLAALVLAALVGTGCGSNSRSERPAKRPQGAQVRARSQARTPPKPSGCPRRTSERPIDGPRWLDGFEITEYYSVPERWFSGAKVAAPGIAGRHRVDWLYSARGVAMQGDGIGLDGRHYHIDALGDSGWINPAGRRTRASACASRWSHGLPAWLEGGWRNREGAVTFPLEAGGWSNGRGVRRLSYAGVTFAPGSSIPLRPYRTIAVDPDLIPSGSRIYIPAYQRVNGGWFVASDTGGAIIGRHLDVYRPPTAVVGDGGRYLTRQRVYVKPPA